jgi:hypothetical protein
VEKCLLRGEEVAVEAEIRRSVVRMIIIKVEEVEVNTGAASDTEAKVEREVALNDRGAAVAAEVEVRRKAGVEAGGGVEADKRNQASDISVDSDLTANLKKKMGLTMELF